jgi:hypothetical protein
MFDTAASSSSSSTLASLASFSHWFWVLLGSLVFHFAANISSAAVLSAVSVVSHQVCPIALSTILIDLSVD